MEKIGEKSPLSASLCLHQRQMIRQGIRRILVMAQLLPGDWPWIGEAGSVQTKIIPFAFEVAARRPGRPLRDSASTRSQQRSGFKGEGYRIKLELFGYT